MNARSGQTILLILLACITILTSGCSETTKEAPPQPDLVFPVSFPLISDGKLFSIEENRYFGLLPEEDESSETFGTYHKLLLDFPSDLFLALDTDPSDKTSEGGTDSFTNTPLPEYIAYADKHTLRLYDLNTRYDHQIYSFDNDPLDEFTKETSDDGITTEAKVNFICDLQKVITWDEEARLARKVLYKDELAVYVKTSTAEDCSEPQQGYQYWQVNIVESSETFTIRRKTLKPHSHEHKHFHDHDNPDYEFADIHDHEHPLEQGELDENGEQFDLNNHLHKHTHTHEFIYGSEHEHAHLSQEEIDAVHTDPTNQEITFETNPVLTGRKTSLTSLDEALMYSGQPIVDLQARNFGYLGLNSKENSFKFYEVSLDTLEKRLLWSAQSEKLAELMNRTEKNTNWRALVPGYNRQVNHIQINSDIVIFSPTELFIFSMESLFDDDADEERANSLTNPVFVSDQAEPYLSHRVHYNPDNLKMVITDNKQLWQIDFDNDQPITTLIKTFSDVNLISIEAKMMASEIMVIKRFDQGDTQFASITAVQESGLENNTILNKTENLISVFNQDSFSFINIQDKEQDNQLSARVVTSILGLPLNELTDTLWLAAALDYRSTLEEKRVAQFSSDNLTTIAGTIEQPAIYFFDIEEAAARGETIGSVPEAISGASGLVLFDDFYTIIEYQNSNNETIALPLTNVF